MRRAPGPARRSPRVYTIGLASALALVLWAAAAAAQVQLTITASMARGPATAAVTIIEFSDYQ